MKFSLTLLAVLTITVGITPAFAQTPDTIQNFVAVPTFDSAEFSWDSYPDASMYRLRVYEADNFADRIVQRSDSSPLTISNLSPNISYTADIQKAGDASTRVTIQFTTLTESATQDISIDPSTKTDPVDTEKPPIPPKTRVPTQVQNLLVDFTQTTMTATWDDDFDSYEVRLFPWPLSNYEPGDIQTGNSFSASDLDDNQKYRFVVLPENDETKKTVFDFTTPELPTVQNLQVGVTHDTITATWDDYLGDDNQYEVRVFPVGQFTFGETGVTDTTYTKTGLTPNTHYRVVVVPDNLEDKRAAVQVWTESEPAAINPPPIESSFTTITDDFTTLDNWEFEGTITDTDNEDAENNYFLFTNTEYGNPAPAATITGEGFMAESAMIRTIDLTDLGDDDLHIAVDYRLSPSVSANVMLTVTDADGTQLYRESILQNKAYNNGWQSVNDPFKSVIIGTFTTNLKDVVSGNDSIIVKLSLTDLWFSPIRHEVSFDNFYIGTSTPPVIVTAPDDITREATGSLTSVTLGTAIITGSNVKGTNDAPSAGFPVGETIVTWTLLDTTDTQIVTITDTTGPEFAGVSDVTISTIDSLGTTVTFPTISATDLVDGDVYSSIIFDPVETTIFAPGTTPVTVTAQDSRGNSATITFDVIVTLENSFTTITDDFTTLDNWEFEVVNDEFGLSNAWVHPIEGQPKPSAWIWGAGYLAEPAITRTIDLTDLGNDDLHIAVDYRAQSDVRFSTVTNAILTVTDADGTELYRKWLVEGGVYDTYWQSFTTNLKDEVSGEDTIIVKLSMADSQNNDWNQEAYFDNFYIGTEPVSPPTTIPPNTIQNFSVTPTSNSAEFSWDSYPDASMYRLRVYEADNFADRIVQRSDSSPLTISNLSPNISYTADIQKAGDASTRVTIQFTTLTESATQDISIDPSTKTDPVDTEKPPIPPKTRVPTQVQNLLVDFTQTTMTATWDDDFDSFDVKLEGGGKNIQDTIQTNSYSVSDLHSGTWHKFTVIPSDSDVTTAKSFTTEKNSFQSSIIATPTHDSISLTWDDDYDTYKVRVQAIGEPSPPYERVTGNNFVKEGLLPDTQYKILVIPDNSYWKKAETRITTLSAP